MAALLLAAEPTIEDRDQAGGLGIQEKTVMLVFCAGVHLTKLGIDLTQVLVPMDQTVAMILVPV
jgi:hypothetical protein